MNQYFPHDFKARSDKKLVSLFMTHGASGIGIFWCIVEMLYEENGYVLRSEYDRIAFELRDHPDCIKAIVEESGLFKFDDDKFWSESVLNRIQVREEKSQKARKSIEKRWNNTNVLRPKNDGNTIKEKKRKEKKKESKVKNCPDYSANNSGTIKTSIPEHLKTIWPMYVEMRKKIKRPLTEHAQKLAIDKLNTLSMDHSIQIQIVEQSVLSSYQGLFPLKDGPSNQQKGRVQHGYEQDASNKYDGL